MTTYCENCRKKSEYTVSDPKLEKLELDSVIVYAYQKHAFCNLCHEEVYPDDVDDYCITEAHDAYRKAIGSITVREIEDLLDKYNMTAQEFSKHLGWPPRRLERYLKHEIPDAETSNYIKTFLKDERSKAT